MSKRSLPEAFIHDDYSNMADASFSSASAHFPNSRALSQIALPAMPGQWDTIYVPENSLDELSSNTLFTTTSKLAPIVTNIASLITAAVRIVNKYTRRQVIQAVPVVREDGSRKKVLLDVGTLDEPRRSPQSIINNTKSQNGWTPTQRFRQQPGLSSPITTNDITNNYATVNNANTLNTFDTINTPNRGWNRGNNFPNPSPSITRSARSDNITPGSSSLQFNNHSVIDNIDLSFENCLHSTPPPSPSPIGRAAPARFTIEPSGSQQFLSPAAGRFSLNRPLQHSRIRDLARPVANHTDRNRPKFLHSTRDTPIQQPSKNISSNFAKFIAGCESEGLAITENLEAEHSASKQDNLQYHVAFAREDSPFNEIAHRESSPFDKDVGVEDSHLHGIDARESSPFEENVELGNPLPQIHVSEATSPLHDGIAGEGTTIAEHVAPEINSVDYDIEDEFDPYTPDGLGKLGEIQSFLHSSFLSPIAEEEDDEPQEDDELPVAPDYANDLSFLPDAPELLPKKTVRIRRSGRSKPFFKDEAPCDLLDSSLEYIVTSPHKRPDLFGEAVDESALSLEVIEDFEKTLELSEQERSSSPFDENPPPLVRPLNESQELQLAEAVSMTNGGLDHIDLADGILTTHDFKTLLPTLFNGNPVAWVNDNIVNEYLKLLTDHVKAKAGYTHIKNGPAPPVHAFPSQWYVTITKCAKNVARWAGRVQLGGKQLLDAKLLLIPICDNGHWRLLSIKPQDRTIQYIDSLFMRQDDFTKMARDWVKNELGPLYVESEWQVLDDHTSERQMNGSDCGVFVCLNALALLREEGLFRVIPDDGMDAARKRIAVSLLNKSLTGEMD